MSTFAHPPPGVTSFGATPAFDALNTTKFTASEHIGNFLLGSDWSALSSLGPTAASVPAVVDESSFWPSSAMIDAALFHRTSAVQPTAQAVATDSTVSAADPIQVSAAPVYADIESTGTEQLALTPAHRHSFDSCYTDSIDSPNSERDFLTSPSMFDDADFNFEGDKLANYSLFPDYSYEDPVKANNEDVVSAFASNLENVKLEADEDDSKPSEIDLAASQSTVMPEEIRVKTEEDVHDSFSTLEAAFNAKSPYLKEEPKQEEAMWSLDDIKPYFGDDETKSAVLSTLAHAFASDFADPIKMAKQAASLSRSPFSDDDQQFSNAGPMRSTRANRSLRSSPGKHGASPAPFIDPVTKAKRWQCNECGKWFDRAYNLKTHQYTHEDPETRARPFACPDAVCQKQFARKHDMQRHFENVHRGESRRAKGGSLKRSRADDLG